MPRFCAACGGQMADNATACPACGKAAGQSAGGGAAAAPAAAGAGLQDNVAGLLAYLFIPAIIFLFLEPYNKNKFVRFHSIQSLILHLASYVITTVLAITVVGLLLVPFVGLAAFVVGVTAAIKAFQGQKWGIPVIAPIAEK